jgi:hypothetical protein
MAWMGIYTFTARSNAEVCVLTSSANPDGSPHYRAAMKSDSSVVSRNHCERRPASPSSGQNPWHGEISVRRNRTELTGIQGARTWCRHGIFAHNLVKIGALAA